MCLSATKDIVRVGMKWKMINIQVTLQLRKPTKTFRKSVNCSQSSKSECENDCRQGGYNRETVEQILQKKQPNLWKNNVSMLHQDNVPAHNALLVKKFLPDKRIPIQHPPYSQIWHPVTFFCTPKWKVYWREPIFHQLKRWRQKWHSYWTAWGLMSYNTDLTMEDTNAVVCR